MSLFNKVISLCSLVVLSCMYGCTRNSSNNPATTIGSGTVYGYLGVESSVMLNPGSMESGTNVTIKFSSFESSGGNYTINVTGGLLSSSGITLSSGAYFNVNPETPILGNANQCQVTSQTPICTLSFQVPASAIAESLILTATIAGDVASYYTPMTLTALPDATPYPGTVQLSTQTSTGKGPNKAKIPLGMNAPLFVNWNNVAINGTIKVALKSSRPNVASFYSYPPGDNIHRQNSATASCNLEYPDKLSCGLGISAVGLGTTTISAIATATNGMNYPVESLILTVEPKAATIRSVIFSNNSRESIAIGITSGGANAYISPTMPAVIPGTPTANIQAGGGSLCGPDNPKAACPIGSTCLQGGEAPVATSTYYCYYDAPTPICNNESCMKNYILLPGGSATLNISDSSGRGDPSGIIWSGNYFARTKCNPATGICQNATCNGKKGGLACGPGTGGSPGVNTLAEVTFQRGHVDFYDVSIINGINFATAFGPTTMAPLATNAYICGTPGSVNPQSGGWSKSNINSSGLPGAAWASLPTESSFPAGPAIASKSARSFYHWVEYNAALKPCITDDQCSNGNKCGYIIGTAYNKQSGTHTINESDASYTRYCGTPIAWITADSIFGLNQHGTNLASLPFNFTQNFGIIVPGSQAFTVGNLQLCINNAYSSYAAQPTPVNTYGNPIMACGGAYWDESSGGFITRVAQPVITAGAIWESNVQPTITWLKQSCPTCYTYPFDDMSATFTCQGSTSYNVTFSNFSQ